jgi:hypothetical protein
MKPPTDFCISRNQENGDIAFVAAETAEFRGNICRLNLAEKKNRHKVIKKANNIWLFKKKSLHLQPFRPFESGDGYLTCFMPL